MSYKFSYAFVRTVSRPEFGGFDTCDILRGCSRSFMFDDFDAFASCFVDHLLSAASADIEGRGVRVYSFFELFGLIRSRFHDFERDGSESFTSSLLDQTPLFLPTGPVKSVELYFTFERVPSTLSEVDS